MSIQRFLGVDLAWSTGPAAPASGVVAIGPDGLITDAGWRAGVDDVLAWIRAVSAGRGFLLAVDAPLIVTNPSGSRDCDRQVGHRYGRWRVSANSVNTCSPRLAGVALRTVLEEEGWCYDAGWEGPRTSGMTVMECYPYTTIVGAEELGYDVARPAYKRRDAAGRRGGARAWRRRRARNCDDLISRLAQLTDAEPPLHLSSHPTTAALLQTATPYDGNRPGARVRDIEAEYKRREDLLDAVICAWTGSFWSRHGFDRCQVLGDRTHGSGGASIVAPARPEQRGVGSL